MAADECIYFDDDGAVFSVSTFIKLNGLPNDARLRAVIIEEVKQMIPGIRILDDTN